MGLSCLFDANTPIVLNECVGIMPKNLGLVLLLSGKNKQKVLYLFIHGIAAVLLILGLGFQFQTVSIIECTYFDKKRPIITDNSKK